MRIVMLVLISMVFIVAFCGEKAEEGILMLQVGSQNFYSETFWKMYRYSENFGRDNWDNLDVIKGYIDERVVPNLLMVEDAYQHNAANDTAFMLKLENNKKELLTGPNGPLYQKFIAAKVKVTDKDVRDLYDKLTDRYRLSVLSLTNQKLADSLYLALKDSADFNTLVKDFSEDPSSREVDGDIGFRAWDDPYLPESMKKIVFSLKPGEISKPIESNGFFSIVKTTEIQPYGNRQSFEKEQERLRNLLLNLRTTERIREYIASIKEKAHFKFNDELLERIVNRMKQDSLPVIDFIDSSFFKSDELKSQFLSYSLGNYTLEEFRYWGRLHAPSAIRQFRSVEELKDVLSNQVLFYELLFNEALTNNLDQQKDIVDEIQRKKQTLLIEWAQKESIDNKIDITDSMLIEFYEANKNSIFYIKPQVSFRMIQSETKSQADAALSRIKRKDDFSAVAKELSTDRATAERGGFMGNIDKNDSKFQPFIKVLDKLKNNEVSSVFSEQGKYYLVQKMSETEGGARPFEQIKRNVQRELFKLLRERRKSEYEKELRSLYSIQYFDDNIRKFVLMKKTEKAVEDSTQTPSGK